MLNRPRPERTTSAPGTITVCATLALTALTACGQNGAAPAPTNGPSVSSPAPTVTTAAPAADTGTHRLRLRPPSDTDRGKALVRYVAWDAKGETLATSCGSSCPPSGADGGGVVLWSARDLHAIRVLDPGPLKASDDETSAAPMGPVFVPGGTRLVAGSLMYVWLWSLPDGKRIGYVRPGAVEGYVYAGPQGQNVMAMTTFGGLTLIDASSGQVRLDFQARASEVSRLSEIRWSRDGAWAVTASYLGPIDLWDLKQGKRRLLADANGHAGIDISPRDGTLAVVLGNGTVQLWDLKRAAITRTLFRGKLDPRVDTPVATVAFDPEGRLLATHHSDGRVRVWDLDRAGDEPVLAEQGDSDPGALSFSPDGKRLAWSLGGVAVWDRGSSAPVRKLGGDGMTPSALHWLGADTLVVIDGMRAAELWDAGRGERRWRHALEATTIMEHAVSPDGRVLAFTDGDLHLVRVADGRALVLRSFGGTDRRALLVDQDGRFAGDEQAAREHLVSEQDEAPSAADLAAHATPDLAARFFTP